MEHHGRRLLVLVMVFGLIMSLGSLVLAQEYGEAPMLEEMVEMGDIPPVEERLPDPEDIYVVEPIDQIGQYGGTLRATTTSPEAYGDDILAVSYPNLMKPSADGTEIQPHIARSLEASEDKKVWTLKLRRGLRWSDGEPFNVDDFVFWYEDVLQDDELMPWTPDEWSAGGELMELEVIDDYTLEFSFIEPHPFFGHYVVHWSMWDLYKPAHHLKNYHPNHVPEEELEAMVEEEGFDNWIELFWHMDSNVWGLPLIPERPTLSSYVLEERTADRRAFVRNPYYWKVDTEGNQLPYIDRLEGEIVADVEIVQGMIMSGDIDFAAGNADIRNYPMYRRYEEEGNYITRLWETGMGSDVIYMVNMTHEDEALREIFQDVRFRRALSLAIDRQEICEVVYFDHAEPRQYTVIEESRYFKPEFAEAYTDYDPDRANALLDEVGLDEYDSEGYRLRPDGERLTFTIEFVELETPKGPNIELVTEHWREVGIDVRSRAISGELQSERAPANLMDANVWHGDKATDMLFPTQAQFIVPSAPGWERTKWPQWGLWFQTDGEEGPAPPEEVRELRGWWEEMLLEPDADRRLELGRKILQKQADNLWVIGTVGNAPQPLIANKDLRNIPETGYWLWDTLYIMRYDPEQLFFDR